MQEILAWQGKWASCDCSLQHSQYWWDTASGPTSACWLSCGQLEREIPLCCAVTGSVQEGCCDTAFSRHQVWPEGSTSHGLLWKRTAQCLPGAHHSCSSRGGLTSRAPSNTSSRLEPSFAHSPPVAAVMPPLLHQELHSSLPFHSTR